MPQRKKASGHDFASPLREVSESEGRAYASVGRCFVLILAFDKKSVWAKSLWSVSDMMEVPPWPQIVISFLLFLYQM